MPRLPRTSELGSLAIDQDLDFQQRSWRVQRIGRIVAALFIAGGLLGVFGRGWLAEREVHADNLHVRHDRFLRVQTPSEIQVRFTPRQTARHMVDVWVDDAFADLFEIMEVSPEPTAQRSREGTLVNAFTVEGKQDVVIRIRVQPRSWGWRKAQLGIIGGPTIELRQLVYP